MSSTSHVKMKSIIPPQSRTEHIHHLQYSCSEMGFDSPEDEDYDQSHDASGGSSYTETFPMFFYISQMAEIDRDTLIHQKGYQMLDKIRDIPQGSMWRAKVTADGDG